MKAIQSTCISSSCCKVLQIKTTTTFLLLQWLEITLDGFHFDDEFVVVTKTWSGGSQFGIVEWLIDDLPRSQLGLLKGDD